MESQTAREETDRAAAGRPRAAGGQDRPLRHVLRPRGPVRFGVSETHHRDAVSLQIVGELDLLTAPKLAAELNMVLRRSNRDVIVDLREADFIDSAGLQILLGARRRLSHASRKLTVMCDDGPVKRVIELARVEDILGVVTGN